MKHISIIIAILSLCLNLNAGTSVKDMLGYLKAKTDQSSVHATNEEVHLMGANLTKFSNSITNGQGNISLGSISIGPTISSYQMLLSSDGTSLYQTDVNGGTNLISTAVSVTNVSEKSVIASGTIYERPDLVPSPDSWFVFDGVDTITAYSGPVPNGADIVIPYQINGKPVLKIGYGAFRDISTQGVVGYVYFPNTITEIGGNAFTGYQGQITHLPANLSILGDGAFDEASGLVGEIVVGENVTSIGNYVFELDTWITSLKIGKNVSYIGDYAFGYLGYHFPINIYWYGNKPTVGSDIFTGCPANSIANIIMNPNATGWEDTFEGMPVIRLPLSGSAVNSYGPLNVTGTSTINSNVTITSYSDDTSDAPLIVKNASVYGSNGNKQYVQIWKDAGDTTVGFVKANGQASFLGSVSSSNFISVNGTSAFPGFGFNSGLTFSGLYASNNSLDLKVSVKKVDVLDINTNGLNVLTGSLSAPSGVIGGIIMTNNTLIIPTDSAQLLTQGQMGWDSLWKTPAIKLNSHVTGQFFLEDFVMVTNITGSTLADGTAVYMSGTVGGYQTAFPITSTNEACKFATKGFCTENIPANGFGHITVRGDVNDLNTTMFNIKDTLYATTTPGAYTNVTPAYPENVIALGQVTISDAVNGRISVNPLYIEKQQETLVGTYYGYATTSDVPSYLYLTNDFASTTNYVTLTVNAATNNQPIAKFLTGTSRVTSISGGENASLSFWADVSKLGNDVASVYAIIRIFNTNMVEIFSARSANVQLDQTAVAKSTMIPIISNLVFSTRIRSAVEIYASHTQGTTRDYRLYVEDGRPLSLAVPLPSGQFTFKSDLENYTTLNEFYSTNRMKLNASGGVASNLTVYSPLIVRGTDFTDDPNRFYPQSTGVQVVGATNQDLYFGLGGVPGSPAWWLQTYRAENPSAPNNPEFLYFSNGQSQKDFMMLSEGGRMAMNKTSNIFDYHSDYLGYLSGGLNDLDFVGTFTYSKQRKYWVYITESGAQDKWSWRKSYDNGLTYIESFVTNFCATTNMTLENGAYVKFDNTTGHNTNDAWIRTGFAQLPPATVHLAPAAYEEVGFTTNYANQSGWEDLTYTMASTFHSSDRYALTNTSCAIYLGRHIKMNSTFFNLAEYAVGVNLVFEYWNGSVWIPITASQNLVDGTANFTQSGQVSWDKSLLADWTTNGITGKPSSYQLYWLRVRSSSNPTVWPKVKNITPQGKVRLGIMGRQFDDDYAYYVDGFGSSYQVKGYQTDTGTTFEANQLITAGAVNALLDGFRNYTLYFSTNNNPTLAPNKLLTASIPSSWSTTTPLNTGTNLVASFVSTNMIGNTVIPANTKYTATYYAAKTAAGSSDTFWELCEFGVGKTNVISASTITPLVQTTPTIISPAVTVSTNFTVSATSYLGVRVYGVRNAGGVSMVLYGGTGYGSSLATPTLGGAPVQGITEAPTDGIAYGRKNSAWVQVLEPNGSGASLSGVVKTTDPKYIYGITNGQNDVLLGNSTFTSSNITQLANGVTNQVIVSPVGPALISAVQKSDVSGLPSTVPSDTTLYVITNDTVYSTKGFYSEVETYNAIPASTTLVSLVQNKTEYLININTNTTVAFDSYALNFASKKADFRTVLNITATNIPTIQFASGITFEPVPEFTCTGGYVYACSTLDGTNFLMRQTYPTVYSWTKRIGISSVGQNEPRTANFYNSFSASDTTNFFQFYLPERENLIVDMRAFIFYLDRDMAFKITYGRTELSSYTYASGVQTNNVLSANASAIGNGYTKTKFFVPSMENNFSEGGLKIYVMKDAVSNGEWTFYTPFIKTANELEVKAYNAGWRP